MKKLILFAVILILPPDHVYAQAVAPATHMTSDESDKKPIVTDKALVVIDGKTVKRSYWQFGQDDAEAGLNPDDIKSISVLTSREATSLYGASGYNGAIQITTKSAEALRK